MPCFSPVEGFRGPDGKLVLAPSKSLLRVPLRVPCGRCIGCRMDRSRDWATRIAHEASIHDDSCFLTLTYRDEALPHDFSVSVREMQLFLKRLRKAIDPVRVRFYCCGEYGDDNLRPHYHVILFGYGFPDRTVWRKAPSGHLLYRSELLERVWTFGNAEIGAVTAQSGGYVARYCLKKVGGPAAPDHYERLHPLTGEIVHVMPEFAVMSNRPGIGARWFDQFEGDCFPSDFVVIDGKKRPVPRYYRNKLRDRFQDKGSDPSAFIPKDDLSAVSARRREYGKAHSENSTPDRLAVREELAHLRQARFNRDVD